MNTEQPSTIRRIVAAATASAALLFAGTAFLSPSEASAAGVRNSTISITSAGGHAAYLSDERSV